jgi:hypothetical protein
MWPSATANDWRGSGPTLERADGKMRGDRLDYAAEQLWPSPTSLSFGESHQPGNSRSYNATMGLASSLPAPATSTDGVESLPMRRTLNPLFVAWLMGWPPPGSIGCGFSETAWCLWWQRMRSALSQLASPPAAPPAQLALLA